MYPHPVSLKGNILHKNMFNSLNLARTFKNISSSCTFIKNRLIFTHSQNAIKMTVKNKCKLTHKDQEYVNR